jgi:hypothetical protein
MTEASERRRRTGKDLRIALAETAPPDERFAEDIAEALAYVAAARFEAIRRQKPGDSRGV